MKYYNNSMETLPWSIQKRILKDFEPRKILHMELLHNIFLLRNLTIKDKKTKRFIMDCISRAPVLHRTLDWYEWILLKVYNGDKPWRFIWDEVEGDDYRPLKLWLRECSRRRFKYYNLYGFSLYSLILRYLP